jgi:hypothetical protein
LPVQEVFTKKKDNNNSIKKGGEGGVEIVDVIREHFDFSPRWDDAANMDSAVAAAGDSAAGDKNAVLDDESTVIQLLPGEVYDFGDDGDSDIVFADKRMRQSKNAEAARPSSVKKKAATVAAVFVTLTVCLGVGYKAGNIMTSKSISSSSSSVTMTALTPEDCLALRSVTKNHEDDGAGGKPTKQRRQQLMRQGKLRRELVERDWKKVS